MDAEDFFDEGYYAIDPEFRGGLDDEYIAKKCYVLDDKEDSMEFVCVDSVAADLLRNRIERMVGAGEIPNYDLFTTFEKEREYTASHIRMIPDMSSEDVVDHIISSIGIE